MTKWPVSNLGDLCTFITDGSHNPPKGVEQSEFYMLSSRDIQNGKLTFEKPRYLNVQDFAVENKRTDVKVGDVLLTTVGTIGRTAIYNGTPEHVTFQRSVSVLRPNQQKLTSKFLMYFLDSITEYLNREARGVAQQGIYLNQVRKLSVPIPPTDEQHKIVELLEDHLSRLDAALADVQQAKLKATQFRRSLLQAAFTGNIGSDGVSPFTEWQTKSIGELADTQLGKMLNKGKQSGNYAKPYLRTDNVHWGRFDLSEIKEMDILPKEQEKYLATKGDLLMCEGGASGRTAIWNEDYDISFQNHVHRIRPKDPKVISPKYLLYYFEWFIKNGYASELIKGVTISSLSQSGLRSIEVSYPLVEEQYKIVEHLEEHLSRLDASVSLGEAMEKQSIGLRRSLLQAAFTGQLTNEVVSV